MIIILRLSKPEISQPKKFLRTVSLKSSAILSSGHFFFFFFFLQGGIGAPVHRAVATSWRGMQGAAGVSIRNVSTSK